MVQAAPPSIDVDALTEQLGGLPSVTDVHDVHVWTLTSGMDVASVHLVSEAAHTGDVTRAAQRVLRSMVSRTRRCRSRTTRAVSAAPSGDRGDSPKRSRRAGRKRSAA